MPQKTKKPLPTASDPLWKQDEPTYPGKFEWRGLVFRRVRGNPILYKAQKLPRGFEIRVYRVHDWTARPWDYAVSIDSDLLSAGHVGGNTPAQPLRQLERELRKETKLTGRTLLAGEGVLLKMNRDINP